MQCIEVLLHSTNLPIKFLDQGNLWSSNTGLYSVMQSEPVHLHKCRLNHLVTTNGYLTSPTSYSSIILYDTSTLYIPFIRLLTVQHKLNYFSDIMNRDYQAHSLPHRSKCVDLSRFISQISRDTPRNILLQRAFLSTLIAGVLDHGQPPSLLATDDYPYL